MESMSATTTQTQRPKFEPLDAIGQGIYTLSEAARLLQARQRSIRRWVAGYDYTSNDVVQHSEPLFLPDHPEVDDQITISFRDLVELRFVNAFTKAGIGLKAIRNMLTHAREEVASDRPFSSARFRTDGRTIFLESVEVSGDNKLMDLRDKQFVIKKIVESTFRDLDLEDDLVRRWRPYKGKPTIVIDPQRAFGQPIAAASGVPTVTLADAVSAEGSVARVARLYEVDERVVRDAVKYQREYLAA